MSDYKTTYKCLNNKTTNHVCLKCGKCGRRFRKGILIDNDGTEFKRHMDDAMREEQRNERKSKAKTGYSGRR